MPGTVILDAPREASPDRGIGAGRSGAPVGAVVSAVTLPLRPADRFANLSEAWRDGGESGDREPLEAVLDIWEARCAVPEKAGR